MQTILSEAGHRVSHKGSAPSLLRRKPLLSSPLSLLMFISVFYWASSMKVESQTNTAPPAGTGQSPAGSSSEPQRTASRIADSAQRPTQAINSIQSPAGVSASVSRRAGTVSHSTNHAPRMTGKSDSSTLCFQPGAGWLPRPDNRETADGAHHPVPLSLLADAAVARGLPQTVDSNDCTPSTGTSARAAGILDSGNAGGLLSIQRQGTASAAFSAGNSQLNKFASSSSFANRGSQGAPVVSMAGSEHSGTSFGLSAGFARRSMPITPSVSSTGDISFSVVSPALAPTGEKGSKQGTLAGGTIYSFLPGRDTSTSQSLSGSNASSLGSGALEREKNRTIGRESGERRLRESSASAEMPVQGKEIHEYRQVKYFCLKAEELKLAGKAPDALTMRLSGGHKATELARIDKDCGSFLAMGQGAAIRKMRKHKGLK